MVIYIFLKFGMVKLFETLQTISNIKMNIFQRKIFNEITLLLFMIYSFIKFKVLVSLPKSFHCPLGMRMHWPTDHAIDHSSIELKRQYSQCSMRFHCLHFLREHMALTSQSQRTTLNPRKQSFKPPVNRLPPCGTHTPYRSRSPLLFLPSVVDGQILQLLLFSLFW